MSPTVVHGFDGFTARTKGAHVCGRRSPAISRRSLIAGFGLATLTGCTPAPRETAAPPQGNPGTSTAPPSPTTATTPPTATTAVTTVPPSPPPVDRADVVAEFGSRKPADFGLFLPGVITRGRRGVALTFDACGGGRLGNGYDADLIQLLIDNDVPATLFLNGRWIAANPTIAGELAAIPLFELANHGWAHVPLTVAGQKAYGIAGTSDAGAAYDEIVSGLDALAELTGRHSPYFRPGTAWCDDVGVAIAERLGVKVIAFDINADAGATASATEVSANLRPVKEGSITLGHFNRPEGQTAEGLAKALPKLLDAGTRFVTVSEALAPA